MHLFVLWPPGWRLVGEGHLRCLPPLVTPVGRPHLCFVLPPPAQGGGSRGETLWEVVFWTRMWAGTAGESLISSGFSWSNPGNYVGFVFDGTARMGYCLRTGFPPRSFEGRSRTILRADPAFPNRLG